MLLLAALTGCEKDVLPPHKSILVVEGWIEDEGFPVVILTESLPVSQDYTSLDNISDYLVKWAKVTVSDGEQTEILIGKYEKGYFPPYVYTTSRIKGKAGRSYTLTVEYGDYYATAATTIPEPPTIDHISIKKCADADTLWRRQQTIHCFLPRLLRRQGIIATKHAARLPRIQKNRQKLVLHALFPL